VSEGDSTAHHRYALLIQEVCSACVKHGVDCMYREKRPTGPKPKNGGVASKPKRKATKRTTSSHASAGSDSGGRKQSKAATTTTTAAAPSLTISRSKRKRSRPKRLDDDADEDDDRTDIPNPQGDRADMVCMAEWCTK